MKVFIELTGDLDERMHIPSDNQERFIESLLNCGYLKVKEFVVWKDPLGLGQWPPKETRGVAKSNHGLVPDATVWKVPSKGALGGSNPPRPMQDAKKTYEEEMNQWQKAKAATQSLRA